MADKEGGSFRGEMEGRLRKVIQLQAVLLSPGTLQDKLELITDAVVDIFGADFARIWMIRPGDLCDRGCVHAGVKEGPHLCCQTEQCLHLMASSGRYTHLNGNHCRVPFGAYKIGRLASGEEQQFHTNDVQNDPRVHNHDWARELGLVSFAGYQIKIPEGKTLGVFAFFSMHPIIQPEDNFLLDSLNTTAAQVILQARAEEKLRHSEQLNQNLVKHLPHRIFLKDLNSVYVTCNANYAHDLGIESAQIAGKDDFAFYPGELAEKCRADDQFVITRGTMKDIEEEYVAEGERRWIHTIKVPYCNEQGDVSGILGIFEDITARKRAEEVNADRNLLCALMDNCDDKIYFKDLQSRFVRCSLAHMRHLRAKGAIDILGKTDHDFFSDEHADNALRDEQDIIRTGEALVGKVEKEIWPDGHVAWALTSKMPLRNESGGIIGTFGISKDITAIKEAEAKLALLHHQLVEASREAGKAEVATSVLHNIGNVLNSVNVSSSVIGEKVRQSKVSSLPKVVELFQAHANDLPGFLADDPRGRQLPAYLESLASWLADEQAEIVREIEAMARNLQHIRKVLAMQQSSAKIRGMIEILPVAEMVEDALCLNFGLMQEFRGIELVREYGPAPPISVEKHKVLQIMGNLIRNAKHACESSDRPDKRITLRIARDGERVKMSVEDNGMGIEPENLVRIFSHGFTTRKDGHGFGLHSSALAARELGGSLSAFSEGPGKGAVFTLELPLEPARKSL